MLSLPENIFTHTMAFVPPKDIFTSKRVSKRFLQELNRPTLWKKVQKINFPTLPDLGDHQDVMRQLLTPYTTPPSPTLT
eukprot:UN19432